MEIDLPQFTQADVLKVTGTTEKNLQNWTSRGVLKLNEQYPGRARRRLYSAYDIIKLQTMLPLTELGILATFAAKFADEIVAKRAKIIERRLVGEIGGEEWIDTSERAYITPGHSEPKIVILRSTMDYVFSAFADGIAPPKVRITVDIDRIISDTVRALLEILLNELPPDDDGNEEKSTFNRSSE